MAKKPIKIYGSSGLSSMVEKFQQPTDEQKQRPMTDPSSDWEGASHRQKLSKDDPLSGMTVKGSKNERKGQQVGNLISRDIRSLRETTTETGASLGDPLIHTLFKRKHKTMAKKPIKIYGSSGLSSMVEKFQQKAEEHTKKQMANPFSEWEGASHGEKLSKDDPRYGRPVEGSKTEKRGQQAGNLITSEIRVLCETITEFGEQLSNDTTVISFGELFQLYTAISNKVVGILLRARKHGLVHFEGEMLFQRRDDNVPITLLKPIQKLHEEMGFTPIPQRQLLLENEYESTY